MARQVGIQFVEARLQRRSNGSLEGGGGTRHSQLHISNHVLTTLQWPCR